MNPQTDSIPKLPIILVLFNNREREGIKRVPYCCVGGLTSVSYAWASCCSSCLLTSLINWLRFSLSLSLLHTHTHTHVQMYQLYLVSRTTTTDVYTGGGVVERRKVNLTPVHFKFCKMYLPLTFVVIQWQPLNWITDNRISRLFSMINTQKLSDYVIIWLLLSLFSRRIVILKSSGNNTHIL